MANTKRGCVVYIEHINRGKDNVCDILVDFKSNEDFYLYCDSQVEENQTSRDFYKSSILIKSIAIDSSVQEESYYCMQLEALDQFEKEPASSSSIIRSIFKLRGIKRPDVNIKPYVNFDSLFTEIEGDQDFDETKSIEIPKFDDNSSIVENFTKDCEDCVIPCRYFCNRTICVRNVKQGNWNELWYGTNIKIVYDLGAKWNASKYELSDLFDDRKMLYKKYKPLLVLSHWDLDHIHCLFYIWQSMDHFSDYFSGLICVNYRPSVKHKQLFNAIQSSIGSQNVFDLTPPPLSKTPKMHFWASLKDVSFYIGEYYKSSRNNSGLCMFVNGRNKTAVFTGDLHLSQVTGVFGQQPDVIQKKEHVLIAPHHGANYPFPYCGYNPSRVIVSYGHNTYGHPDEVMMRLYAKISNCPVLNTKRDGDIFENI